MGKMIEYREYVCYKSNQYCLEREAHPFNTADELLEKLRGDIWGEQILSTDGKDGSLAIRAFTDSADMVILGKATGIDLRDYLPLWQTAFKIKAGKIYKDRLGVEYIEEPKNASEESLYKKGPVLVPLTDPYSEWVNAEEGKFVEFVRDATKEEADVLNKRNAWILQRRTENIR